MRRWIVPCLLLAAVASASGCLKVDSGTVLKKDGSGTYVQVSVLEMERAAEYQKMLLAKAGSIGIPDGEADENPYAQIDAKARAEELKHRRGIEVHESTSVEDKEKKTRTYTLKVGFESLRDFYEAGVIEDMTVRLESIKEGKAWKLTLRHIFDATDEELDLEKDGGPRAKRLRELRKALLKSVEPWWKTLQVSSKLTLPGKVIATNGTKGTDGLSVTWKLTFAQLEDPKNLHQTVTFENVPGLKLEAFHLTANDILNAREEAEMEREEAAAREKAKSGK